jgi:lysophospholipase L1-like esterase
MRIKILISVLFPLLYISCQPRILKVLCLGDSITQGKVVGDTIKELSYRYWLWERLDSAGYKVDMVGGNPIWFTENKLNRLKVPVSRYTGHPFDTDHEAYYGIQTGETLNGGFTHDGVKYVSLKERLQRIDAPDYTFIHIGTNDGQNDSLSTIHSLRQIVEELYLRNPKMHIFLAKLNTPWVCFVNNSIEPLIVDLQTKYPNINLTSVDMASGWVNCPSEPGAMTFDWVHPNELGQKTMANNWYQAFKSIGDKQKPTFISNTKVIEQTDTTATIAWSPASDNKYIAGYDILVDGKKVNWHKSGCDNNGKQCFALLKDTHMQLTQLKKGNTYTIELIAWDFANNSQRSEILTITIH